MYCLIFQGVLCRTLQGHGHWVNILALSTDYVMRTGAFEPASATVVHSEITDTGKCLSTLLCRVLHAEGSH